MGNSKYYQDWRDQYRATYGVWPLNYPAKCTELKKGTLLTVGDELANETSVGLYKPGEKLLRDETREGRLVRHIMFSTVADRLLRFEPDVLVRVMR